MDSMAGAHLVPPSYALPPDDKPVPYEPEIRGWLEEYENKYGRRGASTMTTEQTPIEWTSGEARVIDVRSLVGSTKAREWPASPEITVAHLQAYEKSAGSLRPGDVVIFRTGHNDQHLKPLPADTALWLDPLAGKTEGWPAPGPDAIVYLNEKGIRCIASDAPDLGGVEPKRALMTYWALGSREMVGVEFLVNLEKIPATGGYFLFAAIKVRGCHGGPGRAIVLY
jgi:kynurenine formamidase